MNINIEEYLKQFYLIDEPNMEYREKLSQKLYKSILNKFRISMSEEEYGPFKEYQERVFNLVENLRELDCTVISSVFDYLMEKNVYLIDTIIAVWCLPRTDNYLSKKIYSKKYKELIMKYNNKMIQNINHKCMENFCIETVTKTNSVPVHCIDYIWYYMDNLSLDLSFFNSNSGEYISFTMPEHNNCDEFLKFGLNMEYLLDLGLGKISYQGRGSFQNFLYNIINNFDLAAKLISTQKNFKIQLLNISKDTSRYFGEEITIPKELLDLLTTV